jgi:uncharacterized protein (TIGR00106 family)
MLVAELTIIPMAGCHVRRYVDAAVEVVKASGLTFEVDALGTTLQGELDEVLRVAKEAHQAVLAAGAGRVFTELRLDERVEEAVTMQSETGSYREHPLILAGR